jgi:hypothetical protein
MSYNYLFKIVVIGDHNCGKSCILLRFAENCFRDDHITTLGVDFKLKTIKLDRDRIRLELWDTAGMERYRTIYNSYYHSAHGVMVVYDITDKRSFDNVKNYWLQVGDDDAGRLFIVTFHCRRYARTRHKMPSSCWSVINAIWPSSDVCRSTKLNDSRLKEICLCSRCCAHDPLVHKCLRCPLKRASMWRTHSVN